MGSRPFYIVYALLLNGCTTVMYEGKSVGTPDPGAFWRVISEHNGRSFYGPDSLPCHQEGRPRSEYIKSMTCQASDTSFSQERGSTLILITGRMTPQKPVIDHWWQTETGWPITANSMGIEEFPIKPGSSTKPVPGYDVHVLDSSGKVLAPMKKGLVAIRLPLPPGTLPTLWNDDGRFLQSYLNMLPGYYFTADGGYIDEDGYVFVMGRVDDVINVAGHRLSTGEMEEIVATHPDVAECAVIGAADSIKGQLPLGFVVLKSGVNRDGAEIKGELKLKIRNEIGPIACYRDTCIVARLPKTRSGKILRGTMRKIADGEQYSAPSTIDDPAILGEIEKALNSIGYGKKI